MSDSTGSEKIAISELEKKALHASNTSVATAPPMTMGSTIRSLPSGRSSSRRRLPERRAVDAEGDDSIDADPHRHV
ncbi:hypothetical protein JCM30237_08360 [Halolamina litorea]